MSPLLHALWIALASQAPTPEASTGSAKTDDAARAEVVEPRGAHLRGALEATVASFPSGTPGGAQDLYGIATPLLGFDGGEDFGLEIGAALRLRVFDDPPHQQASDFGGILRRSDWDETSDFGQLLRELRIGKDGGGFALRAGPVVLHTVGRGHLVNRYANVENPDYHPAGASAQVVIGATRTELFASDVLGARLFAGEVSADLGRVFGREATSFDRYHLALSVAHDAGLAGGRSPSISLLHLDFDLAVHRGEAVQLFAFTGVGSRLFLPSADLGALLGFSAEGQPGGVQLGGKLELRKQAGGFRHGLFGPGYELARFSGVGLALEPLAYERLPDGFSGYGEVSLALGPVDPAAGGARWVVSVAGEHFAHGRTDADLHLAWRGFEGKANGTVRLVASGLGQAPRVHGLMELRFRFAPALYALASGGTVYFPQPDSSLVRGYFGGIGLGADFAR